VAKKEMDCPNTAVLNQAGGDLTPPAIAAILSTSLGLRGRFCASLGTLGCNFEMTAV
jgi:hypothetical protein